MFYMFVENGEINGCGEAKQLDENILNIEVSENIFNEYLTDKIKYVYQDNKIVNNPNYKKDLEKINNQKRIDEIKKELEYLDSKRIRAICENEIKDTQTQETWLEYYNNQIFALREELTSLTK